MAVLHVRTPLIESSKLGQLTGSEVYLKLECVQPTGSFKIRGIGNACSQSYSDGAKSLVASSGGNAGLAVAYSGRHLELPVTIVVPRSTLPMMRHRIRAEGADVIQHGNAWDESHAFALQITKEQGADYIHPFDDHRIWAGHASLVHEAKDTGLVPDLIIAAVGGGGLLCGVLQGLHAVGWENIPVMTMETDGAASFAQSVQRGEVVTLDAITSLATSLGAKRVSEAVFDWSKKHEVIARTVPDRSAVAAVVRFANDHRLLVEPACGAALAAVYEKVIPSRYRRILVIVCGGAGVTTELIDEWTRQVGIESVVE